MVNMTTIYEAELLRSNVRNYSDKAKLLSACFANWGCLISDESLKSYFSKTLSRIEKNRLFVL